MRSLPGILLGFSTIVQIAYSNKITYGKPYPPHSPVHITVNKVGPFSNPQETYRYYSLPYCRSHDTNFGENNGDDFTTPNDSVGQQVSNLLYAKIGGQKHKSSLHSAISGDRLETSPYELTFMDDVPWRTLCSRTLQPEELKTFKDAIHEDFYFEMLIEDLRMWGYVGAVSDEDLIMGESAHSHTYLFPHLHFKIGLEAPPLDNGIGKVEEKIVSVSVFTQSHRKVDITDTSKPITVEFSYSLEWFTEEHLTYKNRLSRYVDNRFLPESFEIHWLSIINSFILVLLLTGFLGVILLRVLKNDFSKYAGITDPEYGSGSNYSEDGQTLVKKFDDEETGWKLVHADVLRFPSYPLLYTSLSGSGFHLLTATFLSLLMTVLGVVSTTKRGALLTAGIVIYCLTAAVGTFFSGRMYKQFGGVKWVHSIILTSLIFPVPCFVVFGVSNSIAIGHGSTSALPVATIFIIASLFAFVAFPSSIIGGILGRNIAGTFNAPTRTSKIPREIPCDARSGFKHPIFQLILAGILPFSAIYIELHYIFASVWGHKIYTLFGILFIAFILLVVTSVSITIALVYFQLCREDHNWWWPSFFNGGAVGLFVFFYSVYFYHWRSDMEGVLQMSFYFGYMGVVSFAFCLMLGSVGSKGGVYFNKWIYSRVKCD